MALVFNLLAAAFLAINQHSNEGHFPACLFDRVNCADGRIAASYDVINYDDCVTGLEISFD